jgi:hypothetical protein
VKLKVEREVVFGRVEEVDESPGDLEADLEEVVARSEREDGVQRGDGASARRECEEIAMAVRGQVDIVAPARRWTRELLLEDAHVSAQPAAYLSVFFGTERMHRHAQSTPIISSEINGPYSKPNREKKNARRTRSLPWWN